MKKMSKKWKRVTAGTLTGVMLVGGIPLGNAAYAKSKFKVSTTRILVMEGKTKYLKANQNATFTSTNKKVATVTKVKKKQCTIKGIKAGSCKIVVKSKKKKIKVSVKVTGKKVTVSSATPGTSPSVQPTQAVTGTPVPTTTASAGAVSKVPTATSQMTATQTTTPLATTTVTPSAKEDDTEKSTSTPSVTATAEVEHATNTPRATNSTQTPKPSAEPEDTENTTPEPDKDSEEQETEAPTPTQEATEKPNVTSSPEVVSEGGVTVEKTSVDSVQESANRLGFELFNALENTENGKVISPYSITSAFAMLVNASDGDSYEELAGLLGIEDLDTWNDAYSDYYKEHSDIEDTEEYSQYDENRKGPTVKVSNSIWNNDDNFKFDSAQQVEYQKKMEELYNAQTKSMDFKNGNPKDQINQWVEEKTNGMIKELIANDIESDVSCMLMNTVYFDARWKNSFDKNCTHQQEFYGEQKTNMVDMMHGSTSSYAYYEDDAFCMVELPFNENGFVMDIIMANEEEQASAPQLWKQLSLQEMKEVFSDLDEKASYEDVDVNLPKFTVEYGAVEMVDTLKKMGINNIFNQYTADFPGIRGENEENMYVSSVLHKTKMEVKENGVTAAAATSITLKPETCPQPGEEEPIDFTVDHPFVFAIRDESGMIYFMGEITDL